MAEGQFEGKVGEHVIARLVSQFVKDCERTAVKDAEKTAAKDAEKTASKDVEKELEDAVSNDYKETFFTENPTLRGKVVVHHSVEQQIKKRYPGVFTDAELHGLANLRGIPKELNSDLHLSNIRRAWNRFYKRFPNASADEIRQYRDIIDKEWGKWFTPPV